MFHPKAKSKVSGADKLATQAREAGAVAAGRARDATSAAAQTAAQRATQGVQTAQTAAQSAAQTAQTAAQTAQAAAQTAAQSAAQTAQAAAQTAAQAASTAAQTAAQAASKSVRRGVFSARGWIAPRLENAADYTADTVAPKVSSVLRDTARQISPPDSRKKGIRAALRWSLLATAAAAAAGAAALLVRQRYRAAMAADTEDDSPAAPVQPASATGESATPAGSAPIDGPADAGVNGKVSATG